MTINWVCIRVRISIRHKISVKSEAPPVETAENCCGGIAPAGAPDAVRYSCMIMLTAFQYFIVYIPIALYYSKFIHLKTCSASFANESVRRLLGVRTRRSRFAEVTLPWTRHGILGRNVPAAIPS